jgi:hypothetical protein
MYARNTIFRVSLRRLWRRPSDGAPMLQVDCVSVTSTNWNWARRLFARKGARAVQPARSISAFFPSGCPWNVLLHTVGAQCRRVVELLARMTRMSLLLARGASPLALAAARWCNNINISRSPFLNNRRATQGSARSLRPPMRRRPFDLQRSLHQHYHIPWDT